MLTVSGIMSKEPSQTIESRPMIVGSSKVVEDAEQFLSAIETHLGNIDDMKLVERLGKLALAPDTRILFHDKQITDPRFNPDSSIRDAPVATPEMQRWTAVSCQLSQYVEMIAVLVSKLEKW